MEHKAGLREYTDEFVTNPRVVEMMQKVKTINDPEVAKMGTDKMRSILEVDLVNGDTVTRLADTARGTPEKPLSDTEIYEKFSDCATFVFSTDEADEIYETIRNIEKIKDIRELTDLLRTH